MRARALLLVATAFAVWASWGAAASAPQVDETAFRYVRTLGCSGAGPCVFEPDARLYAHAKPGFADLRVVLPNGSQVPWRKMPRAADERAIPAAVVYRGRRGRRAETLLDVGPRSPRLDGLALEIPDSGFVGRAEVLGSDDRRSYVKLSTTVVYDIDGATSARSTTAVFPPASFRYYLVRTSGVSAVVGASSERRVARVPLVQRTLRSTRIMQVGRTTVVVADLGFPHVPVGAIRVSTATPVFERELSVDSSADGAAWVPVAVARISRLPGSGIQPVDISSSGRFLRLTIANGDDAPLSRVRVSALARSHAILVEGGGTGALRLLYGNSRASSPSYDYTRLPPSLLRLDRVREGQLGSEEINPLEVVPSVRRGFSDRYPWLAGAALAVAALAIGAAGLAAALRPRPPLPPGDGAGAGSS